MSDTTIARSRARARLLDISRIEAGKKAPHFEEFRVKQIVVFEDFRQADNSVTREYGGASLGLAICRRLANMLGGSIELSSAIGKVRPSRW